MSRNPTAKPKNPTAKPRPLRKPAVKRAVKRVKAKRPPARRKPSLLSKLPTRALSRIAAVLLLGGFAFWSWESGFLDRQADSMGDGVMDATASLGLKVGNVQVTGRERTTTAEILGALAVHQGGPLLSFDPYAARERLQALPWVETATVERRLPDLIVVTLRERQPLALWQLNGALFVVDRDGRVIPGALAENYGGLPLVVGPGAEQGVGEIMKLLAAEPQLNKKVVAAVRVGNRRWNLRLEPGIDVRLPETGALEAWQRLARLDKEQGLLSRDLVVIDLRQPDRLVLKPAEGAVVGVPVPGEDT